MCLGLMKRQPMRDIASKWYINLTMETVCMKWQALFSPKWKITPDCPLLILLVVLRAKMQMYKLAGERRLDIISYAIYLKYSDMFIPYHTCHKIKKKKKKFDCWCCKQCRPTSDAASCGIWCGSTLFAQASDLYPKNTNTTNPTTLVLKFEQVPHVVSKNCWMGGKLCRPW